MAKRYVKYSMIFFILTLLACKNDELVDGVRMSEFYSSESVKKLVLAASRGKITVVERLVESGVDINTVGKDGFTPLLGPLLVENKKGVQSLLKYGADPNIEITVASLKGRSAIWIASEMEDPFFLKAMLMNGGDPNFINNHQFGDGLLHAAIMGAHKNRLERVKILVESGSNVNLLGGNEYTPCLQAAVLNQFHIVAYLIENGADCSTESRQGVSLAKILSRQNLDPSSDQYKWREKVIQLTNDKRGR
ncbi:ankyrin repeat domain-containing protein [Porticoccus sp. GXU_MW_L64]